jgi:hypothetical protein
MYFFAMSTKARRGTHIAKQFIVVYLITTITKKRTGKIVITKFVILLPRR